MGGPDGRTADNSGGQRTRQKMAQETYDVLGYRYIPFPSLGQGCFFSPFFSSTNDL